MNVFEARDARAHLSHAIVAAASRRGVAVARVADSGLLRLGAGPHVELVRGAATSRTSLLAVEIANARDLARSLLAGAGLAVPAGEAADSARRAVEIARRLGGRVVVKPADGRRRGGATTGLEGDDSVRAAFERARRRGPRVLVERHLEGAHHRAIVVDGRTLAIGRCTRPAVTGDGRRDVMALVRAENAARERASEGEGAIAVDDATHEMLARQGLSLDAVPPAGMVVVLREDAALDAGGRVEDVTAAAHPAVAAACARAAGVIGLDVAGIDFVCRDPARPLESQRGGIVGVDAAPDVTLREEAVANAIVAMLFPARRH